eukprot:TRINITY_DN1011_c0_g2_i3.p1 TRINITY_DN1011_c0_g2~~TRINITY_DN1011_c0_g2_i3.p1  ORF type:complete len:107 (+),score=3.02 TRINITY_DN1011_c0_g2_i3:250-570(+)
MFSEIFQHSNQIFTDTFSPVLRASNSEHKKESNQIKSPKKNSYFMRSNNSRPFFSKTKFYKTSLPQKKGLIKLTFHGSFPTNTKLILTKQKSGSNKEILLAYNIVS